MTISGEKYDLISKAILNSLGSEGIRFMALVEKIKKRVPKFDGAYDWYAITCLRELETQGKVRRQLGKPVLYSLKKRK